MNREKRSNGFDWGPRAESEGEAAQVRRAREGDRLDRWGKLCRGVRKHRRRCNGLTSARGEGTEETSGGRRTEDEDRGRH